MQTKIIENSTPIKQPSNPEFITPSSHKQASPFPHFDDQLLHEARLLLNQEKPLEAISLFPTSSFMRELIVDHIEIGKMHKILATDAGTMEYDRIKVDGAGLGVDRETRLNGLYHLKKSKCLNNALVNNVSNHLQDILLEQFEPLTSFKTAGSQIFIRLYDKLNQIQHKFQLLQTGSPQIPTFIRQKAEEVLKQNRTLQQNLDEAQYNIGKYQNEASRALGENNSLKESIRALQTERQLHENEKLQLKRQFNSELAKKEEQYRLELQEIRNKSNAPQRLKQMEKDLDVTIDDFKNLIYKLSLENKLLKEERDLLLAQLARVYEKFQIFLTFYQSPNPFEAVATLPTSIDTIDKDNMISDLRDKLQYLQIEINSKNETIKSIKEQLEQLRKERESASNSALDKSISINSVDSGDEKRSAKRYKRTKSGQEAASKVNELEELRRKDKELIENLSVTIEELTEKIKNHLILDQSDSKRKLQPQETAITLSSQIDEADNSSSLLLKIKNQEKQELAKNIEKLQGRIRELEINLEEERQTNASLNAIMEDLHQFEKPKDEAVLTPRMLQEIAELKDAISNQAEKCKRLEQELKQTKADNEELVKTYTDQVINLEFQCSEAQLSISTLENKIYDLEQELVQKERSKKDLVESQPSSAKVEDDSEKQKLLEELNAKNQELQALQTSEELLRKELEDVSSRLASVDLVLNYTKGKNKELERKYKSIVTAKQFREKFPNEIQHALFFGDILQEKPFDKQYLVEILQKRTGKSLRRTKLLWKYDPLNKTNLHQYIDNNEHIVVLIELEDDFVVGGYSQGRIYPKMVSDRDGILFSLAKKEFFEPVDPNKRVVVYDDYYLIFGNSELRVKSQENKLFSNFGINSSYFKSKGMKVDVITNSSEKEVAFKNVEVHQLEFL